MPGFLDKVSLDRLGDKELKINLLCPYCKSTRLTLAAQHSTGTLDPVVCPKCGAQVMLDSLSLVVMKDASTSRRTSA
ncbi:MAG: hypothetical protein ACT4OI_08890 [Methanobacteriota archaeon]